MADDEHDHDGGGVVERRQAQHEAERKDGETGDDAAAGHDNAATIDCHELGRHMKTFGVS